MLAMSSGPDTVFVDVPVSSLDASGVYDASGATEALLDQIPTDRCGPILVLFVQVSQMTSVFIQGAQSPKGRPPQHYSVTAVL